MKIELTVKKKFDVRHLECRIGVADWADATVNGVEDVEGDLIPCSDGDNWCPVIELSTGTIINWEKGKVAEIHYMSRDDNDFKLLDENGNVVVEREGYVLEIMCPKESGYGDYVIMDIDENGVIDGFKADLSAFMEE